MADDLLPFDKRRKPEYPAIEKRKPLSKFEFATLFLHQQGNCANCGARLESGKVRDEHLVCLGISGGNELSNRALWCLACTKPKDAADKARIAKARRIRGETCNGPKRKIQSRNTFSSPSPDRTGKAGRKLRGREFPKAPPNTKWDWKRNRRAPV